MSWSWVATGEQVDERRDQARELAGLRLSSVMYVLLDYGQVDRPVGSHGPRLVEGAAELAAPAWRCEGFDWADYAVEFTTTSGRVFTVSWDSPGCHEGIGVREVRALGSACVEDADVALWDVSYAGRWDSFIGAEITDAVLHYRPWPGGGYWCSRITVRIGGRPVHLLLGDTDGRQRLVPAADNIAVLFPPGRLPEWERYDD